jgi:hypothetical protein
MARSNSIILAFTFHSSSIPFIRQSILTTMNEIMFLTAIFPPSGFGRMGIFGDATVLRNL